MHHSIITLLVCRFRSLSGNSSLSEESPLKPVRKKKKSAIIESDSEDESANHNQHHNKLSNHISQRRKSSNNNRLAAGKQRIDDNLDSDSDLELLDEDWRPPSHPTSSGGGKESQSGLLDETIQLLSQTLDDIEQENKSASPVKLILSNKQSTQEFKMPALPLAPKPNKPHRGGRRRGLRLRSNSQLNSQSSHSSSSLSKHDISDCESSQRDGGRGSVRRRRVPVSLEEELVGEAGHLSDSDEVSKFVLTIQQEEGSDRDLVSSCHRILMHVYYRNCGNGNTPYKYGNRYQI